MLDVILQWMPRSRGLRTLLIRGGIGCGKSTTLQRIATICSDLPVLRLPAHLDKNALTPLLLERARQHLVLIDDVHRMDHAVLTLLLNNLECNESEGYVIASCLTEEPLTDALCDRFALSCTVTATPLIWQSFRSAPWKMPALQHWPEVICARCQEDGYPGHRAEIAWMQAAQACADLQGEELAAEHVEVTRLAALSHRCVRKQSPRPPSPPQASASLPSSACAGTSSGAENRPLPPLRPLNKKIQLNLLTEYLQATIPRGRIRSRRCVVRKRQRQNHAPSIGDRYTGNDTDLHLGATLRQALLWQNLRRTDADTRLHICPEDWRVHVRKYCQQSAYVLVIDASTSMHASRRIALAKAIYQAVVQFAYPRKEAVALLVFQNQNLQTLAPLGSWWKKVCQQLDALTCQGRSPLDHLFAQSAEYARMLVKQGFSQQLNWYFLSDFHPNNTDSDSASPLQSMLNAASVFAHLPYSVTVLDAEEGPVRLGLGRRVALAMNARYVSCQQFLS